MAQKLTAKQKRFVDEYVISLNATEAAINAGYSQKTAGDIGHENLQKPHIRMYIDERLEEINNELIADAQEVMQYLTGVMRGESQANVMVTEGQGEGVSQAREFSKSPDEKERLKAAELLGKRYALFTDRVDINQESNIEINLGDYDDMGE